MKIEKNKLDKLSEREKLYFDIMNSGNCLYLRGRPGTAKSAIGKSISEKIGVKYIDKRLSQIDETDIGLYPVLNDSFSKLEKLYRLRKIECLTKEEFDELKVPLLKNIKDGNIDLLNFAVPDWAFNSNVEPTIIHMEELNRASVHVRNAALQLLNERQIGDLKLNENVFLMSSGNLGEDDGTEVDEMDLALSNRLVIVDHELSYEEWISEYAKYHVWDLIVDFIRSNPGEYYKMPNNNEIRYATPRSWTNLSKFIIYKWGKGTRNFEEIIPFLLKNGRYFIGNSINDFIRYCKNISDININDILNKWDDVKNEVQEFNRARISEMINNLKYMELNVLVDKQLDNMLKFLDSLKGNEDELTSFIIHILDSTNDKNFTINSKIINHFDEKVKKLREYTSRNLKKIEV